MSILHQTCSKVKVAFGKHHEAYFVLQYCQCKHLLLFCKLKAKWTKNFLSG